MANFAIGTTAGPAMLRCRRFLSSAAGGRTTWLLTSAALFAISGGSFLAALGGLAQRAGPGDLAPVLPEIELGPLSPDGIVNVPIAFRNESRDSVAVRLVASSCGCTMVSAPRDIVVAGEVLQLEARFSGRGKTGRVGTRIGVVYRVAGEAVDRRSEVVLWATVIPDVVLSAETLSFDPRSPSTTLGVQCTPGRGVRVTCVSVDHDAFHVRWDASRQVVDVALAPGDWEDMARPSATLTIETTSPTQSLILVPLRVSLVSHRQEVVKEGNYVDAS